MVRKVKVRGLDSIADVSNAIYAATAVGVRASLDSKLSLGGGIITGIIELTDTAKLVSSSNASGVGSDLTIQAGSGIDGGNVIIEAGSAEGGAGFGGDICLVPGVQADGAKSGRVVVQRTDLGGAKYELLDKSMGGALGGYATLDPITGKVPPEQLSVSPDALSAINRLSEFDTPEKRAEARMNLGFAALETYGPPTRIVSTDAPTGVPLDGAEWIVII